MSFLFVDTLQQATSVTSACVLNTPAATLLVPRHDALHTYALDTDPDDPASAPALQHLKSFPVHERIERVVCVPAHDGSQAQALAILSDGSVQLLHAAGSHPAGCKLVQQAACQLQVPPPHHDGMPVTLRPEGPACSCALPLWHQQRRVHVAAASMHHGYMHILKIMHPSEAAASSSSSAAGPTFTATPVHLLQAGLTGAPPPPPTSHVLAGLPSRIQQDIHVRALEVMPAPWSAAPTGLETSSPGGSTITCLLVLLHQSEGPHPSALNLDCMELDWETGRLVPGPWACRNVHPTTSLLLAFDPDSTPTPGRPGAGPSATPASRGAPPSTLPPGMLVFSSRSLQLFTCTPAPPAPALAQALAHAGGNLASAAMALADSDGLHRPLAGRTRLLDWELPGVPACAEWLAPSLLVVGDTMAGLHLVGLKDSASWLRTILVAGPLAAPSVMCYLPQDQGRSGLLFIGSHTSNSQTLLVPADLDVEAGSRGMDSPVQWQMLDPALVKSLAPVLSCVTVPDRQGGQDSWLMVGCGVAPCGRLASVRQGVTLRPYAPDGPDVPAGVKLFPLHADPTTPCHSHLAFSFDAAGCTDVLLLKGNSFTQTSIPGLLSGQPSLLLSTSPGGHLVQATSTSILSIPASSLSSASPPPPQNHLWSPPPASSPGGTPLSISLAAARGGWVAAVAGGSLYLLHVDPGSGSLKQRHGWQLGGSCQVSALSILHLPSTPLSQQQGQGPTGPSGQQAQDGDLFIALGDWAEGTLALLRVSDVLASTDQCSHALKLQLPDGETPRSAASLPTTTPSGQLGFDAAAGSAPALLLVGTNSGTVLLYELRSSTGVAAGPGVGGAWSVVASRQVRVSNVAVELQEVPAMPTPDGAHLEQQQGGQPYVYAHSGSDAIFRLASSQGAAAAAAPGATPSALADLVEIFRVHGSSGLRAVCHFSSETMPRSLAWVDRAGHLLFGDLEAEAKLRWTTAYMGDTPLHTCYHAASHCLVLVTRDAEGGQWLRVVHADSLRQVLAYRLAAGHYVTSLAVEQLPCSSGGAAAAAAPGAPAPSAGATGPGAPAATAAAAGGPARITAGGAVDGSAKEFVVLGSYLLYDCELDPTLAPGLHRTQPLLSFFELTAQPLSSASAREPLPAGAAAAPSAVDIRYALLLHGTCPVPSTCMTLCTAKPAAGPESSEPAKSPAGASQGSLGAAGAQGSTPGRRHSAQPLLLAGGQDGVYAFRVHVDDCNTDGERVTRWAAKAVRSVDPLPFVVPPPLEMAGGDQGPHEAEEEDGLDAYLAARQAAGMDGGDEEGSSEDEDEEGQVENGVNGAAARVEGSRQAGPSVAGTTGAGTSAQDTLQPRSKKLRRALVAVRQHLRRDWSQHVTLSVAARAEAFARSAVTSLQSLPGGVVYAGEFLGSATALQLLSTGTGVSLVPLSADRHPVYAQASIAVSATQVLTAVHPRGLLLLQRSPDEEAAVQRQRRQQAQAEFEAGVRRRPGSGRAAGAARGVGPEGAGAQGLPQLGMHAQDCPGMQALASARLRNPVYKMVQGGFGLSFTPLPNPAGDSSNGGAPLADEGGGSGALSGASAAASVLCLASDGAVLKVSVLPRSSPTATALADLQARLDGLGATDLASMTGMHGPGNSHASSWQLVLEGSSSCREAQAATHLPGALGGEEALPGFSVDGALLRLVQAQARERAGRLAQSLSLSTDEMGGLLASLREI